MTEVNKCARCEKPLTDLSVDFWVFTTLYDEEGECRKTGEPIDKAKEDYLSICVDCWDMMHHLWDYFVSGMKGAAR